MVVELAFASSETATGISCGSSLVGVAFWWPTAFSCKTVVQTTVDEKCGALTRAFLMQLHQPETDGKPHAASGFFSDTRVGGLQRLLSMYCKCGVVAISFWIEYLFLD